MYLENEYIKEQKEQELKEFIERREMLSAQGIQNLPPTAEEMQKQLFEHKDRQAARLKEQKEKIVE
jgi:hypothetical protein